MLLLFFLPLQQDSYPDEQNDGIKQAADSPGKRNEVAVFSRSFNQTIGCQGVEGVHAAGPKQGYADDRGDNIPFDAKMDKSHLSHKA